MAHDGGFAYRPALDGLRAFAVLSVFAYHLGYAWLPGGFLGVDTFFVLSGYLITSLLLAEQVRDGRISFAAFWSRRAKRLLPAVILLVLVLGASASWWTEPHQLDELRGDSLATLGYVANWHLIGSGQSYFDLFGDPSALRHMWSLAIEEQFYVLWPLLVTALVALGGGKRRVLAVACVAGTAASAVLMAGLYGGGDPSRVYYGTDTRAHSLLVGALLALLLGRWSPRATRSGIALQVAGVAAAAGAVAFWTVVDDRASFMYRGGFLAYAALTAVVIAAAVQTGWSPLRTALSWRPLRWIGSISYGVYLWHWAAVVVLTRSRTHLEGLRLDGLRVGATFAAASLSYYLLERRIRYGTFAPRRVLVAAPVALVLAGVLVVGATAGAQPPPAIFDTAAPITAPPPLPSTSAPSTTAEGPTTAPPRPQRLAVVGDSVAASLAWGLEDIGPGAGIEVHATAFPGCGVASGFALTDDMEALDWSAACAEAVPPALDGVAANIRPDVIVWLSTWEMANRREDGVDLEFGTPEHDAALYAAMEDATRRLTTTGAKLVMLTVVPRASSDLAPAVSDDWKQRHYNGLIERLAASHPGAVGVVDLGAIICPGGAPCPDEVDGVRLRPDGGHFTEETAPWVAARLLPEVLDEYADLVS